MTAQAPHAVWRLSDRASIALDRPRLLGILNVTPDSFADGGSHSTTASAVAAAWRMVDEGAAGIDVGGESTRPGAARVPPAEQAQRVLPVIERIRGLPGAAGAIPITIDTTSAEVASAAIEAGADAINDVAAGRDDPAMLPLAASRRRGIILMHRLAPPAQDHYSDRYPREPEYRDVVGEVAGFLEERAAAALAAGLAREAIMLDPGLGFGKSVAQNVMLIRGTERLTALGYPVLSAASRKSFVGRLSLGGDSSPAERLAGTLGLSVAHLLYGARLFRVHDVREHARALAAAWETVK